MTMAGGVSAAPGPYFASVSWRAGNLYRYPGMNPKVGREHGSLRPTWPPAPTPPPPTQQPFEILACRYQHSLDVDLLQLSQAEAFHSMPVFPFSKEWLDP